MPDDVVQVLALGTKNAGLNIAFRPAKLHLQFAYTAVCAVGKNYIEIATLSSQEDRGLKFLRLSQVILDPPCIEPGACVKAHIFPVGVVWKLEEES
ncbi:hypothetical protein TNCV_4696221 [Trichonephila clavipes]|nr:hypothetical protein TNCV_4696221 [Trichonephila clavipes]